VVRPPTWPTSTGEDRSISFIMRKTTREIQTVTHTQTQVCLHNTFQCSYKENSPTLCTSALLLFFGFLITHSLVFSLSLELSTLVSPECLGTGLCTIVLWHWPWHPGAPHCPSSFSLLLPPLVFPLSLHSLEEALFFLQVVLFYLYWDDLQGMEAWLFIASRCPTSSFN
jgi:hypothetical protein